MSESEDEEIHGWVCLKTEDGKPYYYNPDLNKTQWEAPEEGFLVLDDEEVDEEQEEEEEEEEVQDYKEEQDLKHGGHVAKTHGTAAAATAIPTYDEGAPAPAASSPSLSPSAAPSSPKRRVCRWELKKTASFGAGQGEDDGDVYYLNKETGETVWEKPDDYFDDTTQTARRIVNPLAPITEETTLSEGFEVLDIYSEEAQYEVEMMKSGESTGEDCLRRLQYLDELFQNVGEEEEWFDVIMEEEYALAATVYDYFCSNCPEDVRMAVCRLLVRMSKLDEQIGIYIATERWGELSFLLNQVHSGVQYALSLPDEEEADEEEKMQSLFAWFLLVSQVFTATQDYGLPDEVLPEAAFFKPLIKAMEDCTEMVFLAACESCLAVNYHYASRDANQFMSALMAAEENQHFGEALIYILNKQSSPYDNGPLLKQSLRAIADLMSDESSASYFYTNDLKVLIDIFVREIGNLDTKDTMRTDYLKALSLLLNNSTWVASGRYLRKEINKTLESILDVGGDGVDGYDQTVLETVEIVLGECHTILED